jgi:ribosomal protein S18 acetylase RimI-like enzyme
VHIARLGPEDWREFRAVRLAALGDAPHAFGSVLVNEQALGEAAWRAKLASRTQFAACDTVSGATDPPANSIVGTVGGYPDGDAIELISMWVAPAARGRGVGRALVECVIVLARGAGCREVRLAVSEGNAAAERLYARAGFVRTGVTHRIRPGEPWLEADMVLLL